MSFLYLGDDGGVAGDVEGGNSGTVCSGGVAHEDSKRPLSPTDGGGGDADDYFHLDGVVVESVIGEAGAGGCTQIDV